MSEEQPPSSSDSVETHFPTSARPIFTTIGLLVLIVAGLCIIVALQSEEIPTREAEQPASEQVSDPDQLQATFEDP